MASLTLKTIISLLSLFGRQMIHCSLHSAKTNKKAVLWQGNCTCDAVVKFDTYIEINGGIARF